MHRITVPALAGAAAAITAGVLDYIAHNGLGATPQLIRVEALILAAVVGMGLLGSILQDLSNK
jgi:hypothetical protein